MNSVLTRFQLCLAVAAALFVGATAANGQLPSGIPHIKMTDVPITIAIENLVSLTKQNYRIDQKMFAPPGGSTGNGMVEPKLTFNWTNVGAEYALDRVLKENGLVMVPDKFTTVTLITTTNHVANVVDASLLDSTNAAAQATNGPVAQVRFMYTPLDVALNNLIERGHLNVVLDPKVSSYVDPNDPTMNKFHHAPSVSLHWENLTAKQALVALCEAYDLAIVKDAATGLVSIKARE